MALSTPAFAEQNASHSAALFRQAAGSAYWQAHGHLGYQDFLVTAQATPNMSVNVAAGQAWVQGSSVGTITGIGVGQQGSYYALSDTSVTLTINNADPSLPRIDVVYLRILDTAYGDASNGAILGVVTGTAASSPAVPALPANCLDLAHVSVSAGVTQIQSSDISFHLRDGSNLGVQQSVVQASVQLCTEATLPGASKNAMMGQLALAGDDYNLWLHVGNGNWQWVTNPGAGEFTTTVYQSTAQTSIPANTFRTITLQSNLGGNMSDGVGITIPAYGDGYYLVDGCVSMTNVRSAAELGCYVYVNGSPVVAGDGQDSYFSGSTGMNPRLLLGGRVMYLHAGDTVRLIGLATAVFDTNASSTTCSWLTVAKLNGGTRSIA